MLKIGDFSQLARVTIRALRYYNELGLLKPVKVDEFTGYRYYSADQLTQLQRIIALKDMGLSLEEIARLLKDNVSIAHILDILHIKQEEQKQKLEIEAERLKRVEEWLIQVEKEGKMPNYEIVIKKIPPLKVVSIRTIVPNSLAAEPVWHKVEPVPRKIVDYIFKSGSQITGPPMGIFYGEGPEEKDFDMEIAFPVDQDVPSKGEFQCKELPGYDQMVTTIHKGGINSGGPAYAALGKWIEANGYQIIGPGREIYLIDYQIVGPDREIYFGDTHSSSPPREFVTEIQLPIAKV
jgi:effector-binding domain-containing protein